MRSLYLHFLLLWWFTVLVGKIQIIYETGGSEVVFGTVTKGYITKVNYNETRFHKYKANVEVSFVSAQGKLETCSFEYPDSYLIIAEIKIKKGNSLAIFGVQGSKCQEITELYRTYETAWSLAIIFSILSPVFIFF